MTIHQSGWLLYKAQIPTDKKQATKDPFLSLLVSQPLLDFGIDTFLRGFYVYRTLSGDLLETTAFGLTNGTICVREMIRHKPISKLSQAS